MRRTAPLLLLLAICCTPVLCTGKKKLLETLSFDIKPSGQITHQKIKLENGVTCVFTYAAVGGTNEEWSMSMKKTGKTDYKCKVERPEQASYLYFMSFAISVLEHHVEKVEVFDNSGALLQDEDYEITKDGQSGIIAIVLSLYPQ
ncbi:Myeloid-derived growth factor [Geodia barretti]|uniref:Myeloid-derived growth factor n=1 Tax=Geodia barretti TaxID=519541 RepID=A0AA35RS79_GEOBA|nr:Myeloid-derived growth factor [Geodia barretti]